MKIYCPSCGKENNDNVTFCFSCGNNLKSLSGSLCGGTVLDNRYEIVKLIKAGGMGGVYLAKDKRLEETCAVKEMFFYCSSTEEQQYVIDKFKQEAKILAKLRHPNLPVVSDYFVHLGRYYLIMDYIEGEDLDSILIRDGNPGLKEKMVIEWSLQVLDVLSYLHTLSPPIIYRDLKPANIMIKKSDGQVMLVDFGIARILQPDERVTQTKIGTPHYSAPEQFKGRPEQRSDLYSLGATMHHLLTGTLSAPCKFEAVRKINRIISEGMENFLIKALEDKLDDRYIDAIEMKEKLLSMEKEKKGNVSSSAEVSFNDKTPPRVSEFINRLSEKEKKSDVSDVKEKKSDVKEKKSDINQDYWNLNVRGPKTSLFQEMLLIPPGEFWFGEDNSFFRKVSAKILGNKNSNMPCPDDVKPRQKIYLQGFYIDKYPVTNLEFKYFVDATSYKTSGEWQRCFTEGKDNFPVVNISWYDAQEYARWAGKRLPTEQEWEKGARGTDGRIWPWGNCWYDDRLNFNGSGFNGPSHVRTFFEGISPYGIFDMAGNVWEWTSSSYLPYDGNKIPSSRYSSLVKVIKGGAWNDCPEDTRTFVRSFQAPDKWFVDIGFRCVKNL